MYLFFDACSRCETARDHEYSASARFQFAAQEQHVFQITKEIPIWVNFWGSCNGKCRYILWPFGIFYVFLVYFLPVFVPRKICQPWRAVWLDLSQLFHLFNFMIEIHNLGFRTNFIYLPFLKVAQAVERTQEI
jgi:hypothetical protein